MESLDKLVRSINRRKPIDSGPSLITTELHRGLGTIDLIALGLGQTLSHQIYLAPSTIPYVEVGPAVVISLLVSAIASTSNVLCIIELATRIQKCGSIYDYTYSTMGELAAFIVGCILLLTYSFGTAFVIKSVDLFPPWNKSNMIFDVPALLSLKEIVDKVKIYPLDLIMSLVLVIISLLGLKLLSKLQAMLAIINLSAALLVVISGMFTIKDFSNWSLVISKESKEGLEADAGNGGFIPHGVWSVLTGAITCFPTFMGFDGMAAFAEEAKNPRISIKRSLLWTSGIIGTIYFFFAIIQTLSLPYWMQDDYNSLMSNFDQYNNLCPAKWTKTVAWGSILMANSLGYFLPLPRLIYAMARDGLIYHLIGIVFSPSKVPILATIIGGLLVPCVGSYFDPDQLFAVATLGTSAAYSFASIAVLLLRYEHKEESTNGAKSVTQSPTTVRTTSSGSTPPNLTPNNSTPASTTIACLTTTDGLTATKSVTIQSENQPVQAPIRSVGPDEKTRFVFRVTLVLLVVFIISLDVALINRDPKSNLYDLRALGICVLAIIILVLGFVVRKLPENIASGEFFRVPMMPAIPIFNLIFNFYSMLTIPGNIWFIFAGATTPALYLLYHKYGKSHSNLSTRV